MANQNFVNYLSEKQYYKLKQLWNEYASENGYEQIYDSVEEFADIYETDAVELARKVFFGNVQNWRDNVYLDDYENFCSCWSVQSSPIDLDELAKWMRETNHHEYKEWLDSSN